MQWVCQSPFRPTHKRKNWFIGIDAFSSYAAENLDVKLEDITFQTMRASGPGGQHVNTTDSAVRAIHKPTGITVTASEERSQHQNKKLAVARIASELTKRQKANLAKEQKKQWSKHSELERGRPIRVFFGPEFKVRRNT
ncbi:MAG: peptide chain release factor H [Rickettsiaceae bacterium]|nr:peptide chain release factor H [Rickettsiaceae bacterium]